jgi:hypothetical protein
MAVVLYKQGRGQVGCGKQIPTVVSLGPGGAFPATFALSPCPMIFGLNATKSVVIVAETKGASNAFVIAAIRPIPFQVRSGNDLAELLQTLITVFDRKGKGGGSVIALLKCSSGRFGSCLAAIKGEAMVELAASQCGLRVVKIAPQSLKKTLGCAKDQKWRDRAGELFNPDGQRRNWSKGAAGAVAVAFKVAGA